MPAAPSKLAACATASASRNGPRLVQTGGGGAAAGRLAGCAGAAATPGGACSEACGAVQCDQTRNSRLAVSSAKKRDRNMGAKDYQPRPINAECTLRVCVLARPDGKSLQHQVRAVAETDREA